MIPLYVSDIPLSCINEAAVEFHVPAKLIISILNIEQGKKGQAIKNTNGTYDMGPMQINSSWLPYLKKHGITQNDLQFDACKNVKVGAWILGKSIAGEKNLLTGIGDYHSHTIRLNSNYTQKVRVNLAKINTLLI